MFLSTSLPVWAGTSEGKMVRPTDNVLDLTADSLRGILSYNESTGVFIWTASGKIAGYKENNGYVRITIGGRRYLAHRLAWLYVKGAWPDELLDHIDMNRSNNAFGNLREASYSQNKYNSGVHKKSVSGIKGVRLHESGRYQARICVKGKIIHLGLFSSIQEAKNARIDAANRHCGEFVRHGLG